MFSSPLHVNIEQYNMAFSARPTCTLKDWSDFTNPGVRFLLWACTTQGDRMSYVLHLECSRCSHSWPKTELLNLCPDCQSPLLVRYQLDELRGVFTPEILVGRVPSMWRYSEVLPIDSQSEIVSLGEGFTPLLEMPSLGKKYGVKELFTKDESVNPTGSFKARGLSAAVTMARKLGARKLCIPSAGNAGGALAAYASRAGLESYVYIPEDTPEANIVETEFLSTEVHLVRGVITDAGKEMARRKESENWFDVSTLKEPYRIEGKKTMGYEIAEQFGWELPDVILYPTGGGTGLIGMWKAFEEMSALGWIGPQRPRMVAVQSEGCAPMVRAFEEKQAAAEVWKDPQTFAAGIRVPGAVGDFLILGAIRESAGTAQAVSETEIYAAIEELAKGEGLLYCPEGAACWAAFKRLRETGWISPEDSVVVFNTGAGQKYTDSIRAFQRDS